jgi:hypothetical protein
MFTIAPPRALWRASFSSGGSALATGETRRGCATVGVRDIRQTARHGSTQTFAGSYARRGFSDEKVANRDTKVWHLVVENGY